MKKILIADDHRLSAELLSKYLSISFNQKDISIAANGKEVLQKVQEEQPDLLLLDLNMPEMDGIKALRKIRESNNELKIVILSALTEQWLINQAKQYGADIYISKTFNFRNLVQVINRLDRGVKDLPFSYF